MSSASDYRDYNGIYLTKGLPVPGVFSASKISPPKQTPGSLGIKKVLSLHSRWKDEEQEGIKCLAVNLLGDELNQSCSELSAQCHSHRLLCHCLLQLKTGSGSSHLTSLFQDGFPSLGLHPQKGSQRAALRRGSAKGSLLGSVAQCCSCHEEKAEFIQLPAHRQQVWSSFWGSYCITTAAKNCVILPRDLTWAHKTPTTQSLRLSPAREASKPPKHKENPMNRDVIPTMKQLYRSSLLHLVCIQGQKHLLLLEMDLFLLPTGKRKLLFSSSRI